MVGHIVPEEMAQVVGAVFGTPDELTVSRETAASDGPIDIEVRFHSKPPFHNAVSPLPGQFHRPNGHALVLREPDRVRVWGDEEIVKRGLIVNGVRCHDLVPWNGGWQGAIDANVDTVAAAGALDRTDPEERAELDTVQSPTEGTRTYSPNAVVEAIDKHLGRNVRLFGQAASDSGIVCLTRAGLQRFLTRTPRSHRLHQRQRRPQLRLRELQRKPACQPGAQVRRQRLRRHLGRWPRLVHLPRCRQPRP